MPNKMARLNSQKFLGIWGEHPMLSIRFLCFTLAMREQRFFHNPQAALALLLHPNPTEIPIKWSEAAATTIKIQLRHIAMPTHEDGIRSKPACPQGHYEQFALDAETQKIFAFSSALERRAS